MSLKTTITGALSLEPTQMTTAIKAQHTGTEISVDSTFKSTVILVGQILSFGFKGLKKTFRLSRGEVGKGRKD